MSAYALKFWCGALPILFAVPKNRRMITKKRGFLKNILKHILQQNLRNLKKVLFLESPVLKVEISVFFSLSCDIYFIVITYGP